MTKQATQEQYLAADKVIRDGCLSIIESLANIYGDSEIGPNTAWDIRTISNLADDYAQIVEWLTKDMEQGNVDYEELQAHPI